MNSLPTSSACWLFICKTHLLPLLDVKSAGDDCPLCMNMSRQGPVEVVLHVSTSSAWQVRVAFWLKSWENQPPLQCPDIMAKAPKGSERKVMKAARATHACSVSGSSALQVSFSLLVLHCSSCTCNGSAILSWDCHLSHVLLGVEEDEMGRPDWVCSCSFSFRNTAEALQLLPAAAYHCACLSQRWQAFWSWVSSTVTNLGCWMWTCLF